MKPIHIDSMYGVVIHRNFTPLFVDEKYAHMFGFTSSKEVMALSSLFDIIDPKYHQIAQQAYNDVMQGKETPKVRSYVNQSIQGRLFSVLTVDHVIEWEGLPALQITVIDMSMIDLANQQILEQEQKYKDLIWNSLQGIIVHRDFKPLMINPAFVDLVKAKSVAEVMALHSFMSIIPEAHHKKAKESYQKLISNQIKSTNDIVENICFDGQTRYFQLFESVIEWGDGPAVQTSIIDVTEKYHLERKIEYQASHDDLTGLLNRRAITEKINRSIIEHQYHSHCCLLIDIDNFKKINDQFGHSAGDNVLIGFSALCKQTVGDLGFVGRWGGEEFIVFLTNHTLDEAEMIASTILTKCEQTPYLFLDHRHVATVSIGISQCKPDDCSMEYLIQLADKNMYQAKQQGKNQIVSPNAHPPIN